MMMSIRTKLERLNVYFFLLAIFASVPLASVFPARGLAAATLGRATIAVICLLSSFTVRACPAKQL
jgi:hypothetical protein